MAIKTSFAVVVGIGFLRKLIISFVCIYSFFLAGCATHVMIPTPNEAVRKVVVIPVVKHEIGYSSLTGGVLFGAVGVLLEQSLVNKKAVTVRELLVENISQKQLISVFASAATPKLNGLYKNAKIEVLDNKLQSSVNDWIKLEDGISPKNPQNEGVNVEVGFSLEVVKRFTGVYAEGWVLVKLIDNSTNKVIGKTRDNSTIRMSGVRIISSQEEVSEVEFLKRSQEGFNKLISDLTTSALLKMN